MSSPSLLLGLGIPVGSYSSRTVVDSVHGAFQLSLAVTLLDRLVWSKLRLPFAEWIQLAHGSHLCGPDIREAHSWPHTQTGTPSDIQSHIHGDLQVGSAQEQQACSPTAYAYGSRSVPLPVVILEAATMEFMTAPSQETSNGSSSDLGFGVEPNSTDLQPEHESHNGSLHRRTRNPEAQA